MRPLLITVLTLFACVLFAQSSAEELSAKLQENPKDVEVLFQLTDYYKTGDRDSLQHYITKLIELAEESNDEQLRVRARLRRIESDILLNNFDEADSLLKTVSVGDNPMLKIDYLLAKGKIHNNREENDEALEAYYEALNLSQSLEKAYLVPEIYAEIAAVLRENNDLENCTKYFRFAIEEAKKTGNIELQVKACIQMCKVYNGWITVDLDSSVYYGELGMQLALDAGYEFGYASAISIVSAPIIRNGGYRRGLEMSQEALTYADKYNFDLRTRYFLILNQGFSYEKLGIYDSALLKMNEAATLRPISFDHFRLEYLINKSRGRYRDALSAYEVYKSKTDSVQKKRNASKLSTAQARYEANLKEQEVQTLTQTAELQELQLSQQRYLLLGFGVVTILLIIGGVLIYRQRQLKEQQAITNLELEETQKRLELEQQYRASELKAIRSQMNPHFVFNALNSIQEYIMSNERKLAGKYLGKFADLMRIYLQHSQVKTISFKEEIEALSLYLELEKLRFEDSLVYEINIDSNIDMEMPIPSLLMQPYVENAIKHGLLHKEGEKNLVVNARYLTADGILECIIEDNGIGRKRSLEINQMRNPNHKSFAATATKSRLDLLNIDNKTPIEEEIIDLEENNVSQGTRVILRIPLSNYTDWETDNYHSEVEQESAS